MRSSGRLALGLRVVLPSAISLTTQLFLPRLCLALNFCRKFPAIHSASFVAKTARNVYLIRGNGRFPLIDHAARYATLPQKRLLPTKRLARGLKYGDSPTRTMYAIGGGGEEAVSSRHDDGLNPSQREAVRAEVGPVRVVAGPGSGKTRVLTRRISYMIRELGAPAKSILAVTFTKKAAEEMRGRVQDDLGDEQASQVTMGTFHSVCARILRMNGDHLSSVIPGLDRSFSIFDRAESREFLSRILKAEGLHMDEGEYAVHAKYGAVLYFFAARHDTVADYLRKISKFKSRGIGPKDVVPLHGETPQQLKSLKRLAYVYAKYQDRLVDSNAMDFDDIILVALKVLRDRQGALTWVGRRYRHILVDEWQDTNGPQYDLVLTLANAGSEAEYAREEARRAAAAKLDEAQRGLRDPAGVPPSEYPPPSVFVVGDADQCIYRFRGANYSNVVRFEEDFEGCRTVFLKENYRSSGNIARSASAVIAKVKGRIEHQTKSIQGDGLPIGIMSCSDSAGEALAVASQVEAYLNSGRVPAAEMSVLYRTNAQSRSFEEAFRKKGLPFVVVGAQRFYDRREVKDCLAYLRLMANPRDSAAMSRAINTPPRGIGEKTQWALRFMAISVEDIPELSSVTYAECLLSVLDDQELEKLKMETPSRAVGGTTVADSFSSSPEGVSRGAGEEGSEDAGEWGPGLSHGWQGFSIERVRSVRDAVEAGKLEGLTRAQSKKLAVFARLLCDLRVVAATKSISELLDIVLRETDMEKYVIENSKRGNIEAMDRWQNVVELQQAVEHPKFAGVAANGALDLFLNEVVLMSREDDWNKALVGGDGADSDGGRESGPHGATKPPLVQLMTCHASKGLEFNTVFLTGMEEGNFPSELAGESGKDEERRLMYVGMTRAKERLFLSWRKERLVFKDKFVLRKSVRSSFLGDIPRDIVRSIDKTTPGSAYGSHSRSQNPSRGGGEPPANGRNSARYGAGLDVAAGRSAVKGAEGRGKDALEEVTRVFEGTSARSRQGVPVDRRGGRGKLIDDRPVFGGTPSRRFSSEGELAARSFHGIRDRLEYKRYPVPPPGDNVSRFEEENGFGIDTSWAAAELGDVPEEESTEASHVWVGAKVSHPAHGAGEVVALVKDTGLVNVQFVSGGEPFVARVSGSKLKILT